MASRWLVLSFLSVASSCAPMMQLTQRRGCEHEINVLGPGESPALYARAKAVCRERNEGVLGYVIGFGGAVSSGGPGEATLTRDQTYVDERAGTRTTVTSTTTISVDTPRTTTLYNTIQFVCGGPPSDLALTRERSNEDLFREDCRSISEKAGAAIAKGYLPLDAAAPPGQWGCYEVGGRVARCVASEECESLKPAGASKCTFVAPGSFTRPVRCWYAFDPKGRRAYPGGPILQKAVVCTDSRRAEDLRFELDQEGLATESCPKCEKPIHQRRY